MYVIEDQILEKEVPELSTSSQVEVMTILKEVPVCLL